MESENEDKIKSNMNDDTKSITNEEEKTRVTGTRTK